MSKSYDLVVVGSGAAGLAAAVTAARTGHRVVVVEKTELIGGTTATSGGEVWIPCSRQARMAGVVDDAERTDAYIRAAAGAQYDAPRSRAFIAGAPQALAFLEANSPLRYALMPGSPDYHSERAGASSGGRSLAAEPFDGRRLGPQFAHVRRPLDNALIAGGVSVCTRLDVPILLDSVHKAKAAVHAAKLVARGLFDRVSGHQRGTRMTNGNALVGPLLLALAEAGVEVRRGCAVTGLDSSAGRVTGVRVRDNDERVSASGGVLLAAGGFSGSVDLKTRYFAHVADGQHHISLPPASNVGDALRMATKIGAAVSEPGVAPAAWTPVSMVPSTRGTPVPWPHFGDKGKPGVIAVTRTGERFVNEAESYHAFVAALLQLTPKQGHAWLVADHRALRSYGLGAVRPHPWPLVRHLRSNYLQRGTTLCELAHRAGIDADQLERTVAQYNAHATQGVDPEFGRGASLFNRKSGDALWGPNPALGPLLRPPFYAVRVEPGDIGTFLGLRTDSHARVLDTQGAPIQGLYAAGNDATSLFGGDYPAAGITLGPALTFGYLAARHALGMAI
jgi:succinate dehydrogenase/fumarate reductase flavoprotein subunit